MWWGINIDTCIALLCIQAAASVTRGSINESINGEMRYGTIRLDCWWYGGQEVCHVTSLETEVHCSGSPGRIWQDGHFQLSCNHETAIIYIFMSCAIATSGHYY